jgi:hypothetical protein
MRNVFLTAAVLAAAAATPLTASAAPWSVPSNVRLVQKSNVDTNGRIYGTIQAAINSITNASATNPCTVRIMPGVYTESVTMKPFVSLVGSGQESTKIVSAGGNAVAGANDAEIRDLTIEGSAGAAGIYNFDAAPKIRNVTISVSGSSSPGYPSSGIYNYARAPGVQTVVVENVRISITSGAGGAAGVSTIGEWNGSGYNTIPTSVRNSTIAITADEVDGVYAVGVYGNGYSPLTVEGSEISVDARSGTTGVAAGAYWQVGTLSNSSVSVKSQSPYATGVRVFGGWDVMTRILNTPIDALTPVVNMYGGTIRCANVFDGGLSPVACP